MKHLLLSLSLLVGIGIAHADDVQTSVYNFQLKMAQRGSAEAAYQVAQMTEEGRGTQRDLSQALEWYRQAAAKGVADAQLKVKELEARSKSN